MLASYSKEKVVRVGRAEHRGCVNMMPIEELDLLFPLASLPVFTPSSLFFSHTFSLFPPDSSFLRLLSHRLPSAGKGRAAFA